MFVSIHQRETFGLLFVDVRAMNDEAMAVAKLKLAHGMILEFRMD